MERECSVGKNYKLIFIACSLPSPTRLTICEILLHEKQPNNNNFREWIYFFNENLWKMIFFQQRTKRKINQKENLKGIYRTCTLEMEKHFLSSRRHQKQCFLLNKTHVLQCFRVQNHVLTLKATSRWKIIFSRRFYTF